MPSSRKTRKGTTPTRKRKTSVSETLAESQSRKRRPNANTCEVAKDSTTTELIGATHGGNASLKLNALKGLCLLNEQSKWSLVCSACNERIRAKKVVTYDICKPVTQVGTTGKYIVRLIRRHIEMRHPDTWVWNVLPEIRVRDGDGISPAEHFLHQALKAGGANGYVPKSLARPEFYCAFSVRIGNALSWIRWSRMMNKRLNNLQQIDQLRENSARRIETILEHGLARITSSDFGNALENNTLNQMYNKLMLFFSQMGRYRECTVFGLKADDS